MISWHVCRTKSQQEPRAAVELANQDFLVFLPVLASKPMFPGYIFVQFDRDRDPWGKIKNTRGCIDLLGCGFIPANVPDPVIEALMAYRPPEIIPESQGQFSKGQRVQIAGGHFAAGLEGLFQADVKGRTACLLEICGKKVEVPRAAIRAA